MAYFLCCVLYALNIVSFVLSIFSCSVFSQSGKRKSPVQSKKAVPHRSVNDLLPPTPGQQPPQQPAAEPDAGVRYYESVNSRQPKQASVPPSMQYSAVSEEEKGTGPWSSLVCFLCGIASADKY